MKANSHRALGRFLTSAYLPDASPLQCRAFQYGCIQPDQNPMTYLKGSVRSQWLKGHNWGNSKRFICRLACRLENRSKLSLWDYYSLGKLVHYTADSFTYVHNRQGTINLRFHRSYEKSLQGFFLPYLASATPLADDANVPLSDVLHAYHRDYSKTAQTVHTDSRFAVSACCMVLAAVTGRMGAVG